MLIINYRPQTKFGQGNIFIGVCQEFCCVGVCSWGGLVLGGCSGGIWSWGAAPGGSGPAGGGVCSWGGCLVKTLPNGYCCPGQNICLTSLTHAKPKEKNEICCSISTCAVKCDGVFFVLQHGFRYGFQHA